MYSYRQCGSTQPLLPHCCVPPSLSFPRAQELKEGASTALAAAARDAEVDAVDAMSEAEAKAKLKQLLGKRAREPPLSPAPAAAGSGSSAADAGGGAADAEARKEPRRSPRLAAAAERHALEGQSS